MWCMSINSNLQSTPPVHASSPGVQSGPPVRASSQGLQSGRPVRASSLYWLIVRSLCLTSWIMEMIICDNDNKQNQLISTFKRPSVTCKTMLKLRLVETLKSWNHNSTVRHSHEQLKKHSFIISGHNATKNFLWVFLWVRNKLDYRKKTDIGIENWIKLNLVGMTRRCMESKNYSG